METDPMDVQTVLASTPFSMRPGDTAYFTMVYALVDSRPDPSTPISQSQLATLISSTTTDYYERGTFSSPSAVAMPDAGTRLAIAASPNPAGDHVTIRMDLARPGDATLRLTNSLGQTMMVPHLDSRPAGTRYEEIDIAGLPAGLYLVSVEAGGGMRSTRLVLKP